MPSIIVSSRDRQYGEYLKCLVLLLDSVNKLWVHNGPLSSLQVPSGLSVLVVAPSENEENRLSRFMHNWPQVPIILISGNGYRLPKHSDILCLRKPLDTEQFLKGIHEFCTGLRKQESLQEGLPRDPYLIGNSPQIQSLRRSISRLGQSELDILICGQTGTGKSVAALSLHNNSAQRANSLLYINCANIPQSLLESELFGYRKGAFTGAWQDKQGKLEQADGGTVFLDEISEMSTYMQAKFLHVLQEKEFYPVGGTTRVQIKARILAATNADLDKAMAEGFFRKDLFYRLSVVRLEVPTLRQRKEDVLLLVQYFLDKFCRENDKANFPSLSTELKDLLFAHDWPGNVRELQGYIKSLVTMGSEEIIKEELRRKVSLSALSSDSESCAPDSDWGLFRGSIPSLKEATEKAAGRAEAEMIHKALQRTGGKKKLAAKVLQISYKSLLKKVKNYGL